MTNQQGTAPGSLMLAFIAGAAVGAAAALLLTPVTGRETREYLNQRAREGRERAAEAARQSRERATDAARQGRDRAADAARQGREIINRQREAVTGALGRKRGDAGPDSGPAGPEEQGA